MRFVVFMDAAIVLSQVCKQKDGMRFVVFIDGDSGLELYDLGSKPPLSNVVQRFSRMLSSEF